MSYFTFSVVKGTQHSIRWQGARQAAHHPESCSSARVRSEKTCAFWCVVKLAASPWSKNSPCMQACGPSATRTHICPGTGGPCVVPDASQLPVLRVISYNARRHYHGNMPVSPEYRRSQDCPTFWACAPWRHPLAGVVTKKATPRNREKKREKESHYMSPRRVECTHMINQRRAACCGRPQAGRYARAHASTMIVATSSKHWWRVSLPWRLGAAVDGPPKR